MDMMLMGLAIGVAISSLLFGIIAIARAGSIGRASWGLTVAGRANVDPVFAAKLDELLGKPVPGAEPPKPVGPPKPSGEPLRILALLQQEAKFVDFILDDLSQATPTQIADYVKQMQPKAKETLQKYLKIDTVIAETEGQETTVPVGFDPSTIRVLGNVTGNPPFKGSVDHPGLKVTELKLPPVPEGQNLFVLQPAEVQLP